MFTLGSALGSTKIVIQHFARWIEMHATLVSRQIDGMKLPNQMFAFLLFGLFYGPKFDDGPFECG